MATLSFHLNQKQRLFFQAKNRYVAYGGARGGGKSWAAQKKAELMALYYPGIRILMLRRTFPELRENLMRPMLADLRGIASYKSSDKTFTFPNGSLIVFGYCKREEDVLQYQGQQYDVVFIDEATQFSYTQYIALTAVLRGANPFPRRMYLTCNPGGVGHAWVKRLFIDRQFREDEDPEDYAFIPARVYDNPDLMLNDPTYIRRLDALPSGMREAWRDGSWDVFAGQYFTEFDRDIHVCKPFDIPPKWRRYITLDYGLDMLAAYLIAVDEHDTAYVVREVYEGKDLNAQGDSSHKGLTVSQAARRVKELGEGQSVYLTLAPPDLWGSNRETGKSTSDIFAENGVYLTKTSNERVAGWLAVKERLTPYTGEDGKKTARLKIFPGCTNLIRCLPQLRYDERRPSDVAIDPHEITHGPDALRGFCVYWTAAGEDEKKRKKIEWTKDMWEDYRNGSREVKEYLLEKWGDPY